MPERREHWNDVYASKDDHQRGWFEDVPRTSIEMLEAARVNSDSCIVDIGGGDSHLVDHLLDRGLRCVSVLDISEAALTRAKTRLGERAAIPTWVAADVTGDVTVTPVDVWHDRAVFHFLTDEADRRRYVDNAMASVKPGGTLILATFAPDGPTTCSGLPVSRYSAQQLADVLGSGFVLVDSFRYEHRTPWGAVQPFTYARFVRVSVDAPILSRKDSTASSVFSPLTVLTEAMRQKQMTALRVPAVCVLDPDGDIVRWLKRSGRGTLSTTWSCYHSDLYEFDVAGTQVGIIGAAVGAPYAVLLAEQMFVAGCELLISITSAGQIRQVAEPPYFVLATRALRDEGTSYHYQPVARYADADPALLEAARVALRSAGVAVVEGPTWTTDAPFRETAFAVAAAEREGILAVEMETAALYAFAAARAKPVLCIAHVTNTMGQREHEFEKGEDAGVAESLRVVEALLAVRQRPVATDTGAAALDKS